MINKELVVNAINKYYRDGDPTGLCNTLDQYKGSFVAAKLLEALPEITIPREELVKFFKLVLWKRP